MGDTQEANHSLMFFSSVDLGLTRDHRLKFNESAQVGDLVEVNARRAQEPKLIRTSTRSGFEVVVRPHG